MSTVVASMIVKNEAAVIVGCLEAMMPHVGSFMIHDTGSSDGTQDLILKVCDGRGAVDIQDVPWRDFSTNRNQAIDAARTKLHDWIMLMDADDRLVVEDRRLFRTQLNDREVDVYHVEIRLNGTVYHRPMIFRSKVDCRFKGSVHEYLEIVNPAVKTRSMRGVYIEASCTGSRNADQTVKLQTDIALLLKDLAKNPHEPRSQFYLAQSYRGAGDMDEAMRWYWARANNPRGWPQEAWYSRYQMARHHQTLDNYLAAYGADRTRAEPLFWAAKTYNNASPVAHMLLKTAMEIEHPPITALFVEKSLYDYLIPLNYAVCCHYAGDTARAIELNERLLQGNVLPDDLRELVQNNLGFARP